MKMFVALSTVPRYRSRRHWRGRRYACTHSRARVHTHTHTRTRMHARTHAREHARAHTHRYTRKIKHTHTKPVFGHTHTHTLIHSLILCFRTSEIEPPFVRKHCTRQPVNDSGSNATLLARRRSTVKWHFRSRWQRSPLRRKTASLRLAAFFGSFSVLLECNNGCHISTA